MFYYSRQKTGNNNRATRNRAARGIAEMGEEGGEEILKQGHDNVARNVIGGTCDGSKTHLLEI